MNSADIAAAFAAACLDELAAPKPGNVHVFADGHRMTVDDFVRSAHAAAAPLTHPGARVGARIRDAVEATFAAVGTNTNLGIILLCAPLAAAAERGSELRGAVADVLADLDVADAELAFQGIARAAPAGLGRAPRHDVREPPTVTLREAMREAAGRDRIAAQYASDFDDIFAHGLPRLTAALRRWPEPTWATLEVYLGFLAAHPDSHVVRKHGGDLAAEVRRTAAMFDDRLRAAEDTDALAAELMAWDAALKARAINPGTSADLTVGTLFAHRLRNDLPLTRNSD